MKNKTSKNYYEVEKKRRHTMRGPILTTMCARRYEKCWMNDNTHWEQAMCTSEDPSLLRSLSSVGHSLAPLQEACGMQNRKEKIFSLGPRMWPVGYVLTAPGSLIRKPKQKLMSFQIFTLSLVEWMCVFREHLTNPSAWAPHCLKWANCMQPALY